MMCSVAEQTHSQGMFSWAPRAAHRGIEVSLAETMRKTGKRCEGPMRSELGPSRMERPGGRWIFFKRITDRMIV